MNNHYAGFWIRFVAFLIDGFIISLIEGLVILPILIILGFIPGFVDALSGAEQMEPLQQITVILSAGSSIYFSAFLIRWLYYALMQSGPRQATLGKMALGLKVIDDEGNRLSFAKASLRYFGKILSGAFLWIGYIMAGFTEKKQALHDLIAKTYVIKE